MVALSPLLKQLNWKPLAGVRGLRVSQVLPCVLYGKLSTSRLTPFPPRQDNFKEDKRLQLRKLQQYVRSPREHRNAPFQTRQSSWCEACRLLQRQSVWSVPRAVPRTVERCKCRWVRKDNSGRTWSSNGVSSHRSARGCQSAEHQNSLGLARYQ